jgi:Poly(ADP-ribose) polymerase catalytic domain/Poly(ADP-ribose) polymerase, regulatory domain
LLFFLLPFFLISFICHSLLHAAQLKLEDLNFDAAKMPLGKITNAQLNESFSVLAEIESVLLSDTSTSSAAGVMKDGKLRQLTNQFYSNCLSTIPVLIDSLSTLKKTKIEKIDELIRLHVSEKVKTETCTVTLGAAAEVNRKAPIDEAYEKLKADFVPLDPNGPQYAMLNQYAHNTLCTLVPGLHPMIDHETLGGLRLLDAVEITRHGERERFLPSKSLGNRRLLWHGSRTSNFAGILSQGLRIAPPEAPCSGYRFGKGIYFADMLAKSAMYSQTPCSSEILVLACDVSLWKTFETRVDWYMEEPRKGTTSTHGLGTIVPDPAVSVKLKDGDDAPSPA